MAKPNNTLFPAFVKSKIGEFQKYFLEEIKKRKKLFLGALLVLVLAIGVNNVFAKKPSNSSPKSLLVKVDKSYDFPALNNQGKTTSYKIKFKIVSAEKTNQVLVNDKVFTAKNNKLFLILNLELKNDVTQQLNLFPGDLVRMTYHNNEENKFAADLHNNLVAIAPISTKLDRLGFVVPDNVKDFKLYVGELEGKKEMIEVHFPS